MKELFKNKPQKAWFYVGLFLVLALTFIGVTTSMFIKTAGVDTDLIAVIGGEKITKKDFYEFLYSYDHLGTPEAPSKWNEIKDDEAKKKGFLDDYLKMKIMKKEADSQGIKITDEELNKAFDTPDSKYSVLTDKQKELARQNMSATLIEEKLEKSSLGWKSGHYLLYRFDKYYTYESDAPKVVGAGDENLIQEQRKYAEDYAKKDYARLSGKQLTFEQAVTELQNDPKISFKAFAPLTPHIFGEAEKEEYLNNESLFDPSLYQGFKDGIQNLKKSEISKPYVLKAYVNGEMKDVAYVVFVVEDEGEGEYGSKKDWYEALYKKFKTEIYYSNLGIKVENKKYSLTEFLQDITPVANAACPPAYSTIHRTALKAATMIQRPDGTYYRGRGVSFNIAAGNWNDSGGETDLMYYTTTCGSYSARHSYDKKAYDWDGPSDKQGYMYSQDLYTSEGTEYRSVLADCSSTSTAQIYFREPVSDSWIANAGTWEKPSGTTYDNGPYLENSTNNYVYKLDMAGANGDMIYKYMYYKPHYNTPPEPHFSTPGNNATFTIPTGSNTVTVAFDGYATDTNTEDRVALRMAYCKVNASGDCVDSLVYYPSSNYTGWINRGNHWTFGTSTTAEGSGVALGEGRYKWMIWAKDSHQVTNPAVNGSISLYAGVRYFTISKEVVPTLSCEVQPHSGNVPFVVDVTPINPNNLTPPFIYNMGIAGTAEDNALSRTGTFSYTYNQPNNYTITITHQATGTTGTCTPEVTVTNPGSGSGGEVAP